MAFPLLGLGRGELASWPKVGELAEWVTVCNAVRERALQSFSDPTLPDCHVSRAYGQEVPIRAKDDRARNQLRSCHSTAIHAKPTNQLPSHTGGNPIIVTVHGPRVAKV